MLKNITSHTLSHSPQRNQARRNFIHRNANYSTRLEDQPIHVSDLPTMIFQGSVARLPIPPLEDSCMRYLSVVEPLVSAEEYQKTRDVVMDFLGKEGPKLHAMLLKKDQENQHTSYVADYWYNMYLEDRHSLLDSIPFLLMTDPMENDQKNQVSRATNIIISTLRWKKALDTGVLKPDVVHLKRKDFSTWQKRLIRLLPYKYKSYIGYMGDSYPLDMNQYNKMFGTTRQPQKAKDNLVTHKESKHIVVIKDGEFYKVDVIDANGSVIGRGELAGILSEISQQKSSSSISVGYGTAAERDTWADIYKNLRASSAVNSESIDTIESAMFTVSLDDEQPTEEADEIHHFLHHKGFNRWWDKSLAFSVLPSGRTSVGWEHSWGDGAPVVRYVRDIFDDTNKMDSPVPVKTTKEIQPLKFELNEELETSLKKVKEDTEKRCDSLKIYVNEINGLGKTLFKAAQLSPDSSLQTMLQLVQYKLTGNLASTYESANTSGFRHGRTECIRSATMSAKKCAEIFNSDATKKEKYDSFKQANKDHSVLVRQALTGKGIDRHLFVLKKIAEENNIDCKLFKDPSYSKMGENILSTSTLVDPAISGG
eukprot:TRINITY_DN1727_c0_g1_i1.p1 TRINITY_DN1727_c0_g1~~TRINITY_DN1727_c0_g1_i1.p1  ORF type:complete len:594 (+),score=125.02 TRINITY_DN1727_c0_g1_i1:201-1982(+)